MGTQLEMLKIGGIKDMTLEEVSSVSSLWPATRLKRQSCQGQPDLPSSNLIFRDARW